MGQNVAMLDNILMVWCAKSISCNAVIDRQLQYVVRPGHVDNI